MDLTYNDYINRISMEQVLLAAGYRQNSKDGKNYPTYSRVGSDGKRIRGDKYVVTRDRRGCFQPPQQKVYNVISFIKEFPELFREYTPGMSKDRLVNVVCRRLLNMPEETRRFSPDSERSQAKFDIGKYNCQYPTDGNFESYKPFYLFFKSRGLDYKTQAFFTGGYCLASTTTSSGKEFSNLSFPMRKAKGDLSEIVGLEQRGRAGKDGKTGWKGMATGSNASEGLWIFCKNQKPLSEAKEVLWFESGYDAMSYYQLNREQRDFSNTVFLSTGGSPTMTHFKSVQSATPAAIHRLCFDRDKAGYQFSVNFALAMSGKEYITRVINDTLVVMDRRTTSEIGVLPLNDDFNYPEVLRNLDIEPETLGYHGEQKDYVASLLYATDIGSGNRDLLVGDLGKAYAVYSSISDEHYQIKPYLSPEDMEMLDAKLKSAHDNFRREWNKSFPVWPLEKIVHEPCADQYKDWNDQLLGKVRQTEGMDQKVNTTKVDNSQESVAEERRGFHR